MNRNKIFNLVCVPFHDYKVAIKEGFRTRDSHLYKHFRQNKNIGKLVVFNRPTLALEIMLRRKKLASVGKVIYKKYPIIITEIELNTYAVDILDFSILKPIFSGKGFFPELYKKNLINFKKALQIIGIENFATYESSPLSVNLVSELGSFFKVFDGVDNLCKHSTYRKYTPNLKLLYQKAIKNHHLVIFNSKDSIEYFEVSNNPKVHFISNGVDIELFKKKLPMPKILQNFTSPLVIYAGKMQSMFDSSLIIDLAKDNPKCSFVLLGKILEGDIRNCLKNISNVAFLGDIPYELLPGFITNADICIIPYKEDKQHGGDPIKFYEYMAANKPIVSTRLGDIEKFHDGKSIFVVPREKFLEAFSQVLKLDPSIIRISLPADIAWKDKAAWIIDQIGGSCD